MTFEELWADTLKRARDRHGPHPLYEDALKEFCRGMFDLVDERIAKALEERSKP